MSQNLIQKERNYSLDFLKGFLAIGVLCIHMSTFIFGFANSDNLLVNTYKFFSITVALFFLISGYFFMKSNNNLKNLFKLIKIYIFYSIITIIINACFFTYFPPILSPLSYPYSAAFFEKVDPYTHVRIIDYLYVLFVFNTSFGYLWFVKNLIYYQMLLYAIIPKKGNDNNKIKIVFGIIVVINIILVYGYNNFNYRSYLSDSLMIIPFAIGYFLGTIEQKLIMTNKFQKLCYLIIVILIIVETNVRLHSYTELSGLVVINAIAIFILFLNINMKKNVLNLYTKYSLDLLFIQYFFFFPIDVIKDVGPNYKILQFVREWQNVAMILIIIFFTLILKIIDKLTEKSIIKIKKNNI